MNKLTINDLTVSHELDRAALKTVFGGIRNNEITIHEISGYVAESGDVTDSTSVETQTPVYQHYFMWSPGGYPASR